METTNTISHELKSEKTHRRPRLQQLRMSGKNTILRIHQRFSRKSGKQRSYSPIVQQGIPSTRDCGTMTDPIPAIEVSASGMQERSGILTAASGASGPQTSRSIPEDPIRYSLHIARPDETTEEVRNPAADQAARLRIRRRELTLQKSRLQNRRCFCHEGCHCMGGRPDPTPDSHVSFIDSNQPQAPEGEETPTSRPSAPATPLRRDQSPSVHVAFAGDHFTDNRSSNIPASSISLLTDRLSHQSTSTLSQATTAIESRSSGTRSERTSRTNSLPLRIRIGVTDAIRNMDRIDRQILRRRSMPISHVERESSTRPVSTEFTTSSQTDSMDFATRRPLSALATLRADALHRASSTSLAQQLADVESGDD